MWIIAGQYHHHRLISPKSRQVRPSANRLRESLFNICQHDIEGADFLDIFAGSGAIGLEALSRGARSATFIEKDREALRCIKDNIISLGVQDQAQVLSGHVFQLLKLLETQHKQFDLIFADPPYSIRYDSNLLYSEKVVQMIDQGNLLRQGGILFVEEAFDTQPYLSNLSRLKLAHSRRIGGAVLQEYVHTIL